MPDQRILFSKSGTAKYISHLDLMHTMERAFLRAGITIRHTAGFHPHPEVSIPLPLPLGFSSQCELMEFGLEEGCTMEELPQKMNQVLPAGIVIHDCYEGGLPFRALSFVRYDIFLEFDGNLAQAAGEAFQDLSAGIILSSKSGAKNPNVALPRWTSSLSSKGWKPSRPRGIPSLLHCFCKPKTLG